MGFFGTVMAILLALAIRDWFFKPRPEEFFKRVKLPAEKRKSLIKGLYR